jgi:hypothetical protein
MSDGAANKETIEKYSLADRLGVEMPIRLRCDAVAKKAIEIAKTAGRVAGLALKAIELPTG